ncbi:MAG: CAP domain-containing protein [Saccharofermentans sp.]|jgi:uncharacterized protein YkwD|nr:CAP domain-containing protein [Mageeibacillus sp.]MCI1264182.1 CAP domain-containing protein [Saccharofermentans sp.]MCI1274601.1 CAP domain-containing protein [Saccharofermentans sp.]MCI1768702.1 CAP domain-containing protein [Mageeibacillus sp.]
MRKSEITKRRDAAIALILACFLLGAGAYSAYYNPSYVQADVITSAASREPGPDALSSSETTAGSSQSETSGTTLASTTAEDEALKDAKVTVFFTPGDDCYYYVKKKVSTYKLPDDMADVQVDLNSDTVVKVLGFSEDGWAAVDSSGDIQYLPSYILVKTDKPDNWAQEHAGESEIADGTVISTVVSDDNLHAVKFFTRLEDKTQYIVIQSTLARFSPYTGDDRRIDVDAGTEVTVTAISDDGWALVQYLGAAYYMKGTLLQTKEQAEQAAEQSEQSTTANQDSESSSATSGTAAATSDTTSAATQAKSRYDLSAYPGSADVNQAKALLDMVNNLRAENGLQALTWSDTLASCASVRAAEASTLPDSTNMGHIRPDGSEWWTLNSDLMYGENLAYGQTSVDEVFEAWKNSPSHLANMLNPDYKTFGASLYTVQNGTYTYYWVQEFGL